MEYRRLGKSGLQVSALSLGSWLTFGKQIEDGTAEKLMTYAYDKGVNFFDNAEIYARGQSEIVMGNILKKVNWDRTTYLVSSKVFWGGDLPNQKGLMRKHVVEACHAALKRFQLDYLDLFFCHRPDIYTPMEEIVWTMHNLIQQGKILYWGTSEWSAQQITHAHLVAERHNLIAPVMEQPQYNMLHRDKMEKSYLPLFEHFGLGTTIWSPLASGILSGKHLDGTENNTRMSMEGMEWLKERNVDNEEFLKRIKGIKKIADNYGLNMAQMSIAWCLKNKNVSTVILGASKLEQLEQNLNTFDIMDKMNDELMNEIDEVLDNKPKLTVW